MIEPERFDLIGELAAGFPSVVIAEKTIEVYAEDLADIPIESLRVAVQMCRQESRFFPTVTEIRGRAVSLSRTKDQHPDSCACFGTGMIQSEPDALGYSAARRCNGKPIGPPDPDADVNSW